MICTKLSWILLQKVAKYISSYLIFLTDIWRRKQVAMFNFLMLTVKKKKRNMPRISQEETSKTFNIQITKQKTCCAVYSLLWWEWKLNVWAPRGLLGNTLSCVRSVFLMLYWSHFLSCSWRFSPHLVKRCGRLKKKTRHFFHLSEKCLQAGWAEFFCSAVPGLCRHRETRRVRRE